MQGLDPPGAFRTVVGVVCAVFTAILRGDDAPGERIPERGTSDVHPAGTDPVLLFDGVCHLCQGTVQFVLRHERDPRIRFCSLQGEVGSGLLRQAGLPRDFLGSVVLIHGSRVWTESDAVLELATHLRAPWCGLRAFSMVPRPWRNLIYRWVARHRYRWFGRSETCLLPTPALRSRFLG